VHSTSRFQVAWLLNVAPESVTRVHAPPPGVAGGRGAGGRGAGEGRGDGAAPAGRGMCGMCGICGICGVSDRAARRPQNSALRHARAGVPARGSAAGAPPRCIAPLGNPPPAPDPRGDSAWPLLIRQCARDPNAVHNCTQLHTTGHDVILSVAPSFISAGPRSAASRTSLSTSSRRPRLRARRRPRRPHG
jgi:hypothetical protein